MSLPSWCPHKPLPALEQLVLAQSQAWICACLHGMCVRTKQVSPKAKPTPNPGATRRWELGMGTWAGNLGHVLRGACGPVPGAGSVPPTLCLSSSLPRCQDGQHPTGQEQQPTETAAPGQQPGPCGSVPAAGATSSDLKGLPGTAKALWSLWPLMSSGEMLQDRAVTSGHAGQAWRLWMGLCGKG